MEISGSNALNRSMQNLWTNHRRNKVNLNSSAPGTPSAPSPVGTPAQELTLVPATEEPVTAEAVPTTDVAQPGVLAEGSESRPPVSSGKRKVRVSKAGEEGYSKRPRTGGDAVAKDYTPPSTRLSDLGGVSACVEKMLELVAMPLCHPEVYLHTGIRPPRGVLLHGPPGCGKTLLANAIAGELGVPFINISAPSVVSGMSGESEKTLRDTFEEAKRVAPCLLFIDEVDAITPKRESAQREMERRIVAQFLTCMDDMSWEKNDNKPVIVIGATNRPDSLDAALRRAGRFDHEISMGVPDEEARLHILQVQCSKLRLEGNFDFRALAKATPGYVGADLSSLTGAAGVIAVKRIFQQLSDGTIVLPQAEVLLGVEVADTMALDTQPSQSQSATPNSRPLRFSDLPAALQSNSIAFFLKAHPDPLTESQLQPLYITFSDFTLALEQVQPSSKREGFATVPDVSWTDIGALHSIREELHMAIVQPIKRPELFKKVGISAPCGVLLWGPPGCGKTLLAKAAANESKANFISIKGPELLNKYVGESERAVRQVFARARASSPCVIFFDELDALVPRRDESMSESSARVVNTLLTELDGLDQRRGVYVMAATNRPDMIDPAMCRPGRFDKMLFVDLPNADERAEIMRTVSRNIPLGNNNNTYQVVEEMIRSKCDGYSGADLAAVVREAGAAALKRVLGLSQIHTSEYADDEMMMDEILITQADFERALAAVGPSVSPTQRKRYERLRTSFLGYQVKIEAEAPINIPS